MTSRTKLNLFSAAALTAGILLWAFGLSFYAAMVF
jgi:hypothetical protein